MRSVATSEFEDCGQPESEQTGLDDMEIDNDADDEKLDDGRSNKKVCTTFSLLNDTKCIVIN